MLQNHLHHSTEDHISILISFWERLHQVKQLSFHAESKSKEIIEWAGKGNGSVIIAKENDNTLIFNEKGSWLNSHGTEFIFSNILRWTLDPQERVISLEHLRRGVNHPVFLVDLAPSSKHSLTSLDSHLCGADTYFGQLHLDNHCLRLNWRVIGPKKNEEIDYFYS